MVQLCFSLYKDSAQLIRTMSQFVGVYLTSEGKRLVSSDDPCEVSDATLLYRRMDLKPSEMKRSVAETDDFDVEEEVVPEKVYPFLTEYEKAVLQVKSQAIALKERYDREKEGELKGLLETKDPLSLLATKLAEIIVKIRPEADYETVKHQILNHDKLVEPATVRPQTIRYQGSNPLEPKRRFQLVPRGSVQPTNPTISAQWIKPYFSLADPWSVRSSSDLMTSEIYRFIADSVMNGVIPCATPEAPVIADTTSACVINEIEYTPMTHLHALMEQHPHVFSHRDVITMHQRIADFYMASRYLETNDVTVPMQIHRMQTVHEAVSHPVINDVESIMSALEDQSIKRVVAPSRDGQSFFQLEYITVTKAIFKDVNGVECVLIHRTPTAQASDIYLDRGRPKAYDNEPLRMSTLVAWVPPNWIRNTLHLRFPEQREEIMELLQKIAQDPVAFVRDVSSKYVKTPKLKEKLEAFQKEYKPAGSSA